jgi:hypothetical protein
MAGEDKSDISFVIQGITTTPQHDEVEKVSIEASAEALKKLQESTTLTDYLRWHQSLFQYFTFNSINWMWDYGGTTVEDLITDRESDRVSKSCEKSATAAESMKSKIEKLEPKKGMLRVALKRIRESSHSSYSYAVLAAFPSDVQVSDTIDRKLPKDISRESSDIVLFQPTNACVNHACDDLYKINRDSSFYMPYRDVYEAIGRLDTSQNGVNEYLLDKSGENKIKQDTENYILVALHGGFSNEVNRCRVSDFWNKSQTLKTNPELHF